MKINIMTENHLLNFALIKPNFALTKSNYMTEGPNVKPDLTFSLYPKLTILTIQN